MSRNTGTVESPRSKRSVILAAAIQSFGDDGFELTKWASVADKVGIGQTALYHYFESKVHCLLTIMSDELQRSVERFESAVEGAQTPSERLRAAIHGAYDVTPQEVLQMRILESHMHLLGTPRTSEREEAERLHARSLVREVEQRWAGLLQEGIDAGEFGDRDPLMTSRTLLALVVSVWRWYRTGGPTTLDEIREYMSDAALRLVAP